jgi:DNA primase
VIDWVMKANGVSFRHAVELLRADHPSLAAPMRVVSKGTTAAVKLEAPFEAGAGDQQVLGQVVDYYHDTLKQSPEAVKYLQARGLDHPEMIGHFRLGFSNRTLGYRLPEKNRKSGAEIRGRLQRLPSPFPSRSTATRSLSRRATAPTASAASPATPARTP